MNEKLQILIDRGLFFEVKFMAGREIYKWFGSVQRRKNGEGSDFGFGKGETLDELLTNLIEECKS